MNRFVNPLPSAGKGTIFIIQNRVDLRPPPGNTASIADRGNKVASNVYTTWDEPELIVRRFVINDV